MPTLLSPANVQVHSKGPNFLLIVILSGIALIFMLILAYVVLIGVGDKLVPNSGESTARLVQPALPFKQS